jgi:hypothetical protein
MTIYDPRLRQLISEATARIPREMAAMAPAMAVEMEAWMHGLPSHGGPADYFLHPLAFPMFLLPWWLEESRGAVDLVLEADLVASTVSGYYYIRMIDDLMDGDVDASLHLLPGLGFFHTRFQGAYQKWFPAGHPFWADFDRVWCQSAEASMLDASLETIDIATFQRVAARKICAAKIPLAAVCHHRGWSDAREPWWELVDLLGCWHQMTNDVFDWHKDLNHGNRTCFLCQAGPEESVVTWVVREGFAWGCALLEGWAAELQRKAVELGSKELVTYLAERQRLYDERKARALSGLGALGKLAEVMG